jgi:hypothetical protein
MLGQEFYNQCNMQILSYNLTLLLCYEKIEL